MPRLTGGVLYAIVLGGMLALPVAAHGEIRLIGTLQVPGSERDRSGLTEELAPGLPHNLLSGGSGIAWTGRGDRYLVLPDRGPADGASAYRCRWHLAQIRVRPGHAPALQFELQKTSLLRSETDEPLTGSAQALDPNAPAASPRFDPEGVRIARDGSVYVSDEYGPHVAQFTLDGRRIRTFELPARFSPRTYAVDPTTELAANTIGRQPNGGLEGLAISPSGDRLFAIMQKPLLQDGAYDADKKRVGTNLRILEIDVEKGASREFVYPLESAENGVSEVLAANGHSLLVLERDSLAGTDAKFKRIYRAELKGASDVSHVDQLPGEGVSGGVKAVTKSLFLDLLDPQYGLAGADFPGKIEGLCFGPDLPNGDHLLLVTADNDFRPEFPNLFYAFSVPATDLPGYKPQRFDSAK